MAVTARVAILREQTAEADWKKLALAMAELARCQIRGSMGACGTYLSINCESDFFKSGSDLYMAAKAVVQQHFPDRNVSSGRTHSCR